MDKELKAKWVAALRGGEYKQGRGLLLDSEGRMCCLGVLEHVCGTPRDRIEIDNSCLSVRVNGQEYEYRGVSLAVRNGLANMNDGKDEGGYPGKQYTFAELADWIEANL